MLLFSESPPSVWFASPSSRFCSVTSATRDHQHKKTREVVYKQRCPPALAAFCVAVRLRSMITVEDML